MRWCAFFARDPEENAKFRPNRLWNLGGVLLAVAMATPSPLVRAEETVAPISSSAPLDRGFLLLPAYDLELAPRQPEPSPQPTRVGDELDFRVGTLKLPGATIGLPAGQKELEDQGWAIEPKPSADGDLHLMVTPTKAGQVVIPSLEIRDPSGKGVARTNPLSLEVASAIHPDDPSKETPAEMAPPVGLPYPLTYLIAGVLLGLLVLTALGYFGFRWWKKRQALKSMKPAAPPKPEDVLALEALEQVAKSSYLLKGDYKKHYFRISETLKTYLGARYEFDALESTTAELIDVMANRRLVANAQLDKIQAMFGRMDRVKFTDHVPETQEGETLLEEARSLIQSTRRMTTHAPS